MRTRSLRSRVRLLSLCLCCLSLATNAIAQQSGPGVLPGYQPLGAGGTFSGPITFSLPNLITTSTDALICQNTTLATVGVPVQISPRCGRMIAQGWDTDDAVSRPVSFFFESLPTGTTTVAGTLKIRWLDPINSAITYPLTLTSVGGLTVPSATTTGSLVATTGLFAGPASSGVGMKMAVPTTAGNIALTNGESTFGVTLKVDVLPTFASGFGTTPVITTGSTPLAGSINVGSGTPGTGGVINWAGAAFPSAPFTICMNQTTLMSVRCTATTTQLTIAATAFTAGDVVTWMAISAK